MIDQFSVWCNRVNGVVIGLFLLFLLVMLVAGVFNDALWCQFLWWRINTERAKNRLKELERKGDSRDRDSHSS